MDILNECFNLNVNINIMDSFNKVTFKTSFKNVRQSFYYVNTRLNHLELTNNNNQIIEIDDMDEMDNIRENMDNKQQWYSFKRNREGITKIIGISTTYVYKSIISETIKTFNEEVGIDKFSIFHKENKKMSNFVLNGTYLTNAINFKTPVDESKLNHIDQVKSYLQYAKCGYYRKFPTIFTNFRRFNKMFNNFSNVRDFLKNNVGFYQIGSINLNKIKNTNTNAIVNKLISKGYIRNNIILPSPELEYLMDIGVRFFVMNGLWADVTIDITEEDTQILTKKLEGRRGNMVSPYALWAGINCSYSEHERYYINTDKDVASDMKGSYDSVFYDNINNLCIINYQKDVISHKAHFGAFIFSYQRINLIQQLCKFECNKIVRVVLDGIFFEGEQPELFNKFRVKEGKYCEEESSFINGLTRITKCEKYDLVHYKSRENFRLIGALGQGGAGKTHSTIMDNKDLQILYIAPSYTLCREKEIDFEELMIKAYPTENIYKGKKWIVNHKDFPIVVIDEITMLTEEKKKFMINKFPYSKIYFCGDLEKTYRKTISYQLPPISGDVMSLDGLDSVYTYNTNYRFKKGDKIRDLVKILRKDIKKGYFTKNFHKFMKDNNRIISMEQLKEMYDIKDYVLCSRKTCNKCEGECVCGTNHIKLFNDLLGDKGEKYLITVNGKSYSNGDIIYELPKGLKKNFETRHAFTNHQTQGKTIRGSKIFIYGKQLFDITMAYVAVSRGTCLDQIYLIE